jgi:hypothetical protein
MFSEPQYKPRGQVELPFVAAETRGTARSRVPPRSSKVWRKQRSLSSDGAPRPACCGCLRSIGERNRRSIHVASVPLDGDRADVAKTAQLQGRILGATEEEVKATTAAVSAALQHQLGNGRGKQPRAIANRELPVTLQLEDGTLVEGVADLVREGEGGWSWTSKRTRNWPLGWGGIGARSRSMPRQCAKRMMLRPRLSFFGYKSPNPLLTRLAPVLMIPGS